jgi:hypothetical protein
VPFNEFLNEKAIRGEEAFKLNGADKSNTCYCGLLTVSRYAEFVMGRSTIGNA